MAAPLVDLVAPLVGELARFCQFLTQHPHDADDLTQESLLRVFAAREGPAEPRSMRAWLFTVARRARIDQCRKQAARERFVLLAGGMDELPEVEGEPSLPDPISQHDLEKALAELPEATRAALVLTDVWEFDHQEVAEILDLPVGTVKSRVARARMRLAARLESEEQAPRERKTR